MMLKTSRAQTNNLQKVFEVVIVKIPAVDVFPLFWYFVKKILHFFILEGKHVWFISVK